MNKLLQVMCLLFLVSACSTTGSMALKKVSPMDIASNLKVGITTKEQLVKIMGAPNSVSITQEGLEIITYEYKRSVPSFWNFTPIVLFSASSETDVKQLVVLLNKNKTVKETITNVALLHGGFGIFK